jgi:hypothetical protein
MSGTSMDCDLEALEFGNGGRTKGPIVFLGLNWFNEPCDEPSVSSVGDESSCCSNLLSTGTTPTGVFAWPRTNGEV